MMNAFEPDRVVRINQTVCLISELDDQYAKRFQVLCEDIKPFAGMNADLDDYLPAFVIRKANQYFAYLNRCAHLPMEMDWNPAEFLDEHKSYIICSTHHALYEIDTGRCIQGPCPKGSRLIALKIDVMDHSIIFKGSP